MWSSAVRKRRSDATTGLWSANSPTMRRSMLVVGIDSVIAGDDALVERRVLRRQRPYGPLEEVLGRDSHRLDLFVEFLELLTKVPSPLPHHCLQTTAA